MLKDCQNAALHQFTLIFLEYLYWLSIEFYWWKDLKTFYENFLLNKVVSKFL